MIIPEREGLRNPGLVAALRRQYLTALYCSSCSLVDPSHHARDRLDNMLALVEELARQGNKVADCYFALRIDSAAVASEASDCCCPTPDRL